MKTLVALGAVMTLCGAYGAVPEVSGVAMTQNGGNRLVTISYKLSEDAVVTLDVQTNATDGSWCSIGGEAICNAQGEVWRKVAAVSAATTHTITWRPDLSWPGHKIPTGGARAVVTAWALDNTPDYMVVDLTEGAQPNTQRYYPAVEFLPGAEHGQVGAITNNPAYRTTQLVMRKISASGIRWTMGSTTTESQRASDETTHQVTLTNNYYIGVFEFTQGQWALVRPGDYPSYFTAERAMRPIERVSFNRIRMATKEDPNAVAEGAKEWPEAPYAGSFLGQLNAKTGLDFDLPSEAQWEFACRAGHGDGFWGNGSPILNSNNDANLSKLGRYIHSGGIPDPNVFPVPSESWTTDLGTAKVGSYEPNSWGLYDMHGNVWEWCLDNYAKDITALDGTVCLNGLANRVARGGAAFGNSWDDMHAMNCRAARRHSFEQNTTWQYFLLGFRVVCRAGLE